MSIRYAVKADQEQVKALWNYCFVESESFSEYFFEKRYDHKDNLIVDERGVRASLMLNPYRLRHGSIEDRTRYVVGISVWPEYRGMKYTTAVLKKAFMDLYEQGETISLLMPINTQIYRRYGYENCFDMDIYTLDLSSIAVRDRMKIGGYRLYRIASSEDKQLQNLVKLYQRAAKKWDCHLVRDEIYYQNLYQEIKAEQGEMILCRDEDGEDAGYMIFYPKFEPLQTGFVREMIVIDSSVYAVFLSLIQNHGTQIKQVVIHQPKDSLFSAYMGRSNQIRHERKPFLMARILHVRKILESLCIKEPVLFRIHIEDSMIEQNEGMYLLSSEGVTFEKEGQEADVSLTIGELTLLYMGQIRFSELCFIRHWNYDTEKVMLMERLFPLKTSYINDYI